MILIDYRNSDQRALIQGDTQLPDPTWSQFVRVCFEQGEDVSTLGTRTVSLPWWSFLSIRDSLRFVFERNSIRPQFSDSAKAFLREAQERQRQYDVSARPLVVTESELQRLLANNGMIRTLTQEQIRNVAQLARLRSAATFSVPGAGKTTEALAFFTLRNKDHLPLFVFAPKNAFPAWEEQVELCFGPRTRRVVRLQGGRSRIAHLLHSLDIDIALITYHQFAVVRAVIAQYLVEHPSFVFLDESHRIKAGFAGVQGSAVLSVSHLPSGKLILSGTPMPNSTADLVPQFRFLYPEIVVDSATVVDRIQPLYVRTTKHELGLREPVRYTKEVTLGVSQERLYRALRSEAARQAELLTVIDRAILRRFGKLVVRLLQACTEPALLLRTDLAGHDLLSDAVAEGPGAKVIEACRIARELASRGQKCIIWSQFVRVVENISNMLADIGADFIHGGVEVDPSDEIEDSREQKIRRFHSDPDCWVLVANPAACAEGISLHTCCHHAIYVDRSYNAAHYLQSEDRIHRLGLPLEQNTFITILGVSQTIDDSVRRRLISKVDRMRSVLNDRTLSIEASHPADEGTGLDDDDIADIRNMLLGGE